MKLLSAFAVCHVAITTADAAVMVEDGGGELDLFVREIFSKYDEFGAVLDNTTLECSTCSDSVGNGCVVALNFHIPSECDYYYGSFQSVEYDPTTDADVVCVKQYQDEACTIPQTQACFEQWTMDQCGGTFNNPNPMNPLNQWTTRLPNWCIRSSEARDDFVVQIYRLRQYESLAACQTGNTTQLIRSALFGANDGVCFREPVDASDGTILPGSAQTYCEGSVLKANLFSDQSCSNQTYPTEPFLPQFNFTSEECSKPFLNYGIDDESQTRIVDCNAPTIFCKDIAGVVRFVSRIDDTGNEPSSGTYATSSAPSDSPTLMHSGEPSTEVGSSPSMPSSATSNSMAHFFVSLFSFS